MVQAALKDTDVRNLIFESAGSLRDPVQIRDADVSEITANDQPALSIRVAVARPDDRARWIQTRVRLAQAVRDKLIDQGDYRYPFIQFLTPDEWTARDNG